MLEATDAAAVQAAKDKADAARWRALMELCGHFGDGSDQTVTLISDDATRSCFIAAGRHRYGTDGSTFNSIMDAIIKGTA